MDHGQHQGQIEELKAACNSIAASAQRADPALWAGDLDTAVFWLEKAMVDAKETHDSLVKLREAIGTRFIP